ncbi:MAG: hypothetical protein J7621_02040 [Niastella sp.]|nr:hypothetical protein [Niastella sp.]
MQSVLVELKSNHFNTTDLALIEKQLQENASSFKIDIDYPLVPMHNDANDLQTFLIRGEVNETQLIQLKTSDKVLGVFNDGPIAPFG